MKGLTIVTLIVLILTLVMFVGFLVHVLFGVTNESIKQRTSMNANEIAGVINLIQTSPPGTFHIIDLDKNCAVEVHADNVTVTIEKRSSKAGIIKTALAVEPANLECKDGAAYVMRCGDTIKIAQKKKPC